MTATLTRKLTMPWPPSVNAIWRVFGGRIILSSKARDYAKQVARALPPGRVPPPMTGRLWVWLVMNPPARMARGKRGGETWDIANREKCLCDALTKQRVWLDDSQIDVMVIQRGQPAGLGSVDVTIVTIPADHRPL